MAETVDSPVSGPSGGVGWDRRLALLGDIRRPQDDLKRCTDEGERQLLRGFIESLWDEYRSAEETSRAEP